MMAAIKNYLHSLVTGFGQGWNRFWFQPTDPLPLAAIRIGIGLLAFYWVATFSPDLEAFFGKQGLLRPEVARNLRVATRLTTESDWSFSYLNYVNQPETLWIAHLAGLAVLALFTAGVATRVTSVLALVVVTSYIHRASLVAGTAEPVLAFVMFYLCFGPSGAYLSVDRWWSDRRARRAPGFRPQPVDRARWSATIALRLIQVHLVALYFMSALAKLHGDVWWSGAAVWWLIAKPETRLIDLTWLHPFTYLVNALTHGVVIFELAFGVLIWNRLARPLMLVGAVVMWSILAPITGLVTLAWGLWVASLAFVSPDAMRAALRCCCGRWLTCCQDDAAASPQAIA